MYLLQVGSQVDDYMVSWRTIAQHGIKSEALIHQTEHAHGYSRVIDACTGEIIVDTIPPCGERIWL